MSQESAFIDLVLQNPDDDGPRLVYADWLEEHGGCDRAEFIRIQCELNGLRSEHFRRPALEHRQSQLLLDHRQEWEPSFDRPFVGSQLRFEFARGFPELHTDIHTFLALEYQFLSGFPVTTVHLDRDDEHPEDEDREFWDRLVLCPFLDRVVTIDMFLIGIEAQLLLESPHLTRLRTLSATLIEMTDRDVNQLASHPAMAGLVDLQLIIADELRPSGEVTITLGDEAARGIGASSLMSKLRRLDLPANGIGNEGALALADAPRLHNLRRLDLATNHISERGALALANSPYLEKLEWLNLAYNFPGPRGEEALRKRFGDRVHLR